MHAHAIPEQPAPDATLPGSTRQTDRVQDIRGPERPTISSWVSLAAVAALLIGIVGAAWGLREGGGGEEPQIRLASTALDETPVAEDDSEWLTWVQPEECTVEPMTTEEYAEIMREEPDISDRSYEVVGPADPETAEAVASAARAHEACLQYGSHEQVRSLESPDFLFYRSANMLNTLSSEEEYAAELEHSQRISEQVPDKEPSEYAVISADTPPDELWSGNRDASSTPFGSPISPSFNTFEPHNAILLEDGRVALPITSLYWEEDPWIVPPTQEEIDTATQQGTLLLILTNESGEWKLDEQILFCNGADCDDFWAERMASFEALPATPTTSPLATPEE